MTAVCFFVYDNTPMMIGDLAVSGPEDGDQQLEFPHRAPGNEPFPIGSGYVIRQLRQKIVSISPNLVMAWSGRMINAIHLARSLRAFVTAAPREWSGIRDFLEAFDREILEELSVIFLYTKDSVVEYLGLNTHYISDEKSASPSVCIGSGGELLCQDIHALKNRSSSVYPIENSLNEHYTKAAGLVAGLIRKETTQSVGFEHYYGGGYELCGVAAGQIAKMDGITFAFWDLRITGTSADDYTVTAHPSHVTRYVYVNDVLVVKALHLELVSDDSINIRSARIIHVHPLLREKIEIVTEDLSLESNVVCTLLSIFVNNSPNAVAGMTANQFLRNADAAFEITQIDSKTAKYKINSIELRKALGKVLNNLPRQVWERRP